MFDFKWKQNYSDKLLIFYSPFLWNLICKFIKYSRQSNNFALIYKFLWNNNFKLLQKYFHKKINISFHKSINSTHKKNRYLKCATSTKKILLETLKQFIIKI
jgi:hypothetical protein